MRIIIQRDKLCMDPIINQQPIQQSNQPESWSSFSKVLLILLSVIVVVVLVGGSYYLGIKRGISIGKSEVSPTPATATPTIPPKYITPPSGNPQVGCNVDSDCTLYDSNGGPCGRQCVSAYDYQVIAVNKGWLQEQPSQVGTCPMYVIRCSDTIVASWKNVKAVCKNSVCTKSQ